MESYVNLRMVMESKQLAIDAVKIIKSLASNQLPQSPNEIKHFIEDIVVSGNMVIVEESCSLYDTTFHILFKEIYKNVAKMLKKDAVSKGWYYDCAGPYEESISARRIDDELEITTVIAPNGNGICPECGEQVVCYAEYNPYEKYYCPNCGEELDHSDMFDGDCPETAKERFPIV